jgi:hypothetical protein
MSTPPITHIKSLNTTLFIPCRGVQAAAEVTSVQFSPSDELQTSFKYAKFPKTTASQATPPITQMSPLYASDEKLLRPFQGAAWVTSVQVAPSGELQTSLIRVLLYPPITHMRPL